MCEESVSLGERSVVGVVCILSVNRVGVVCTLDIGVVIEEEGEEEGNVADLPGLVPPAPTTPTALKVSTGLCFPCPAVAVAVGVGPPTGDDSNVLDWEMQEVVMCG